MENPNPIDEPSPSPEPSPVPVHDPELTPLDEEERIKGGIEINET